MVPDKVWNAVAQISHVLGGAFVVMANHILFGDKYQWCVTAAAIVLAAIKEFVFDNLFETADERGSNLRDFSFYMVGLTLGHVIVYFGH